MRRAAVDIDAEAHALANDLARGGHPGARDEIHDAIAGGATGTEILVRLSGVLYELGKRRRIPERPLRRRARRLRRRINYVLRASLRGTR